MKIFMPEAISNPYCMPLYHTLPYNLTHLVLPHLTSSYILNSSYLTLHQFTLNSSYGTSPEHYLDLPHPNMLSYLIPHHRPAYLKTKLLIHHRPACPPVSVLYIDPQDIINLVSRTKASMETDE